MEMPHTFETKKTNKCKRSPLSMAACKQLLRKILPPVSLLSLETSMMEPIIALVKNEYCELRF